MTPTPRETALLAALIAEGTLHGAARAMTPPIAYGTARKHMENLRRKTGLTREQLVAVGVRDGWLVVPRRLAA